MTTQDLLNLKKQVDEAKITLSESKGERKVLLEKLSTDFDCTFEEVGKVREGLEDKVAKLEKEKQKIITKLEEDYDF